MSWVRDILENQMTGKNFNTGICALMLFGLAGCSGLPSINMPSLSMNSAPLQVDIEATAVAAQIIHTKRPVLLHIAGYSDARNATSSGKIGNISAPVNDMLGTGLYMQDIPATISTAMAKQLSASGFQTTAHGGQALTGNSDFEISGIIREFTLHIAGRDEVSIVLETTLRDTRTGAILWSGAVAEKADRFAGVTGNTRNSVTRFLADALAKVTSKTRDALSESLMQAYPDLFLQAAPARRTTPGVTVLVAPVAAAQTVQLARTGDSGRLTIVTTPSRVKVYVGDVYYGLSPLKLDLEAGIHTLHFRQDALKAATEKVSVRKGETTELEMKLER
jgi:hypothetical protein